MTIEQQSAPLGLRDRKRLETRARIEAAAAFLVLRDGLEATTVDAISVRADVSPRTFFNYFESKDSAVLGIRLLTAAADQAPEPEPAAGEADLLSSIVGLILSRMAPSAGAAELHRDRMEIIRRHPEILASQFRQLTARNEQLTASIADLLAAHPGGADDPDAKPRADIALALCGSAARAAVLEWAETADPTTIDRIHPRAVGLAASTLRRLA